MHSRLQTPANRIVLLGASNLIFSLRMIIQLMQQHCGSPSEVLVAAGHGRSYGQNSLVLVRELPGIVQCGLWRQLGSAKPMPVYAFLTDVGNDILYGYSPHQILAWVSWCIHQLHQSGARIVMTNLPMASVRAMPERRFMLLRNILFPTCRLSRDQIVERASTVYQGLHTLAERYQLVLYEPKPEWMSIDGIHVSIWKRRTFYRQLFCGCADSGQFLLDQTRKVSDLGRQAKDESSNWQRRPRFAVRRLFGKIQRAEQPSGSLEDNTTVALY
ncbi:hypothetical protein SAMN05216326_1058 [Nitrosomonas marina]|uniref:GDSL-like Lipase/Acylhydrolase family protein n=1 Tax=Nitrosomonas marina TaxID=917 RepID=A0A1H9ZS29_9PROT|nr:hypothetical protein [Nitrosomonas marina]SES83986.1 hypothetical protein SAMN05216326_1058 [Nitrosomonas marina]